MFKCPVICVAVHTATLHEFAEMLEIPFESEAKTTIVQDVRGETVALKLRTALLTIYAVHISRNTVPTIFTNSHFSRCVQVVSKFRSRLGAYLAVCLEVRSSAHCVLFSSALNASHAARQTQYVDYWCLLFTHPLHKGNMHIQVV